jgi:dihydrofolate synthase/folylpolyglutamate synthase
MKSLTEELLSIPKFGSGIGLHRMNMLCDEILKGSWANQVDPINVVGSNGKGSTTRIIGNILMELGLSTGQYISPHLFEFSERISINNEEISEEDLSIFIQQFFSKRDDLKTKLNEQIGAFEAFTFIAFAYFAEKQPDTIVLEAGIGGRYDSTRILTGDFIAFTSLDLEHTQVLGDSEELIAYDKIDIAREGATVVVGDIHDDVLTRLIHYASYKNVRVLPIRDHSEVKNVSFKKDKMLLDVVVEELEFTNLESNLVGYQQVSNIVVSILLIKRWLAKNYPEIDNATFQQAVYKGLATLTWTGRLEKIHSDPSIIIDVGHTPKAIEALVTSFKDMKTLPCVLVTGVSYDKEVEDIVTQLTSVADAVVCTRAYHKGSKSSRIFDIANKVFPNKERIFQHERIEDAVDFSIQYAKENNMQILIAGGLFLSIEAYHYLKGNVPSELTFF